MNKMIEGFIKPPMSSQETKHSNHERLHSPEEPRRSEELKKLIMNDTRIPTDLREKLLGYAEHFAHTEDLALTDGLTGLPNKREFTGRLEWLQDLNARHEEDGVAKGYSVVAFDLDGFKAINDTFGHEAGDLCLKLVAEEVGYTIRHSDLFAREGGDEFVILLPETNEAGATETIEKVFTAIDKRVTERLREVYPTSAGISASIGTVSYEKGVTTDIEQKDVLKLADYVRYVVKAAGKKAAITLKEAREIDSNNIIWEQFVEGVPLSR